MDYSVVATWGIIKHTESTHPLIKAVCPYCGHDNVFVLRSGMFGNNVYLIKKCLNLECKKEYKIMR